MGLRKFDWTQLPEIPVDTGIVHGPSAEVESTELWADGKVVGILTDIKESVAGVETKGYITDDRVLGYLKGGPTEFSVREPEPEEVEWDIDANVPMYTRDYLRLEKERRVDEMRELQRWIDESEGN